MGAYGWKATIGFIGPPRTNETVLHEAFALAPAGISWCWSVMGLPEFGQYEFDEALASAAVCARELAARKVNIIVVGGIPLMTSKQPGYHLELHERLAQEVGHAVPVTSDLACVLGALRAFDMHRVALCSIYQRYIQDNFKRHLRAHGVEAVADVGLEYELADCMTKAELGSSYEAAVAAWRQSPDADGMVLACPQWPVINNLARIEKETLGKPVIAHLPAIMWGALSQLGVREPRPEFGRLIAEWPAWPVEAPARAEAAAAS